MLGKVRGYSIQLGEKRIFINLGRMGSLCIIHSLYPFFTHFAQERKERGYVKRQVKKVILLGRLKNEEVRRGA